MYSRVHVGPIRTPLAVTREKRIRETLPGMSYSNQLSAKLRPPKTILGVTGALVGSVVTMRSAVNFSPFLSRRVKYNSSVPERLSTHTTPNSEPVHVSEGDRDCPLSIVTRVGGVMSVPKWSYWTK